MARIWTILKRLKLRFRDYLVYFQRSTKLQLQSQMRDDIRGLRRQIANLEWLIARPTQNPVTARGWKVFSQSDEDGIVLEIMKRINLTEGIFVEIGIGDGLENNTLVLLAQNWRGAWFDTKKLAFDIGVFGGRLSFAQGFITAENVVVEIDKALATLQTEAIDFLSVDVDGNDFYLLTRILESGFRPAVMVIEINPLFPPPLRYVQPYSANFQWDGLSGDSGVSLQTVAETLQSFSYFCVGCNEFTGVNAFFVSENFRSQFLDVPSSLSELYVGPKFGSTRSNSSRTEISPNLISQIARLQVQGGVWRGPATRSSASDSSS